MNSNQVKGRIEQAKGKIKEVTGDVTDNHSLENKGKVEKNIGRGQATMGDAAERAKDVVRDKQPR